MAKKYSFGKSKRKSLIAALCAISVTCTGLAAACAPADDEDDNKSPSKTDSALLKNGSFEFFDIPEDAVYLIKNVSDWSLGGGSSVKSGIIGTSDKDWEALSDEGLAAKLDYNYDVGSTAEDYVDYNSMRSRDILYKEPYAANLGADKLDSDEIIKNFGGLQAFLGIEGDKDKGYTYEGKDVYYDEDGGDFYFDEDFTNPVRKAVIANPETHYGKQTEKDGKTYLGETEVYKDEDGTLYDNEDKENTVGNVLMLHNYATDGKYNGIQQYYTSTSITLEANTAAEISLWVKTSDLKFDKGYSALEEQDKGASIEVVQTVNGNSLDAFVIKNINTEKIIAGANGDDNKDITVYESNGWLNYKIYVNACDFASSTIQLRLGLGRENEEQVTGYAFFDDVTVTKYRTLDDKDCGYSSDYDAGNLETTSCNLASEADEKVFNADKELRASGGDDLRFAYNFVYSLDLASETGDNSYEPITFGDNGVQVETSLTTEKDGLKLYAASATNGSNVFGNVTKNDSGKTYDIVKNFNALPTANDLTGIFNADYAFSGSLFPNAGYNTDYSKLLNEGLTGDKNGISVLPKYDSATANNMLVTLSAWGASYTNTISSNSFTLNKDGYAVISFWVKTSDVDGTAATLRVYDKTDTDKKDAQSFTVNSTGVTTNFGDEKDIYNGWVPCFIFVSNETDEDGKQFDIDFCFGPTTVKSAAFNYGWAAVANMHVLSIDEDIYNLASSGDRTVKFAFSEEDENKSGNVMDEASGTYDIKTEISAPSNYNGINGQNSSITGFGNLPSYDAGNTHPTAGLINKEYFGTTDGKGYSDALRNTILNGFGVTGVSGLTASEQWAKAFGDDCYQPLIIINNLRQYVDKAEANATNYGDYFVECKDGETAAITVNGKNYRRVDAENEEFSEDETYYSLKEVCNYGFIGTDKTISSSSYETVSVRVKVTGNATAYIYLVDPDTAKVLSYSTPSVTFYYDNEGNVLDEEYDADWKESEHRKHIVYTLRSDGLYEDAEGTLHANLHNLAKSFKNYQFEHETFYNEDGEPVSFDNLTEGENYYTSADKDTRDFVNHYLTATDGTRIFEYKDGTYYYIVDNKTTETAVANFDAEKYARYSYEQLDEKYLVEVTDTNGEWVTVNFFIHTGSADKKYRLELWSGKRDETGVTKVGENSEWNDGAVAFDYSAYSITSSNYDSVISEYETEITEAYKAILNEYGKGEEITSNSENIAYYEELIKALLEEKPEDATLANKVKAVTDLYNAKYYTYTLYDAPSYIPFNEDTAENGSTGYDYNADDFGELLAYFRYNNENLNSVNVFADYSAVDQSISLNTDSGDTDDGDDDENTANGDLWLYISSIILVVVLLITLVAILVRDYLKKHRGKKSDKAKNKNVYRQRDRYIKKLHLVKEEIAEDEVTPEKNAASPEEEATAEQTPVEEAPAEAAEEENVEAPSEEAAAEEPAATEESDGGEDKPE